MHYIATKTMDSFHASGAFGRWAVGPVGSGKTTASLMELMLTAAQQEKAPDGLRYTRMGIVRNTLQQLRTTVLSDALQLFRGAAEYHVTTSTVRIRTGDICSDWLLMPLDTPDDQRRLLSTQLTMIYVNEFREVPQSLVAAMSGRVGRYPSPVMGVRPTRFGIIGDSNPYADGSEWHNFLEVNSNPEHVIFRQPSGMSKEAENKENLPPGYYERLVAAHGEDWVKVHVHGLNGDDMAGLAVFKASFDWGAHVDLQGLSPNRHRPLMIGLDFGRTPTALITQVDLTGRLLVFQELTSENMGIRKFCREVLRPVLLSDRFAGLRSFIVADPAGRQRSQIGEETLFDALKTEGFLAVPAPSNDIKVRLRAVEKLLLERRPQGSGLVIDGPCCPKLVLTMRMNYRYKRRRSGDIDDAPEKNHPWSDLADSLQYAALGAGADLSGHVLARDQMRGRPRVAPPPVRAWT